MKETIEQIRKEVEYIYNNCPYNRAIDELTAQCAEMETQIKEQEDKASQAFNSADISAYEDAISRKAALQEMLPLTREKLERQSSVPILSKAMEEEYKKRINDAVKAEEDKQVKKMLSLIDQIIEILHKNEKLCDDSEDLHNFVRQCMREPKDKTFHTSYIHEHLLAHAERLRMKISDCMD